jgi:hypothetical protein
MRGSEEGAGASEADGRRRSRYNSVVYEVFATRFGNDNDGAGVRLRVTQINTVEIRKETATIGIF